MDRIQRVEMMIKGAFIILFFLFLGNGLSFLMEGLVPGSVCGMLLLFCALAAGWIAPSRVESVALTLTRNMALFFVPAGVGLMASYTLIAAHWVAILTVSVVTTVLVIAVVALTQERLEKFSQKKTGE